MEAWATARREDSSFIVCLLGTHPVTHGQLMDAVVQIPCLRLHGDDLGPVRDSRSTHRAGIHVGGAAETVAKVPTGNERTVYFRIHANLRTIGRDRGTSGSSRGGAEGRTLRAKSRDLVCGLEVRLEN